jgi:diguanylate cyclase (GGDEF)-like protein
LDQAINQAIDPGHVKSAELFNSLFGKEVEYIAKRSGVIRLSREDRLFSAGQRAEHFYMLLEGAVEVFKPRENGDNDHLAQYAPGDTIGEFDFIRRAGYEASARALEDSALIIFPAPGLTIEDFIAEEPRIVSRILLNSLMMMIDRIKSTQNLFLENLSWTKELQRRAYEDPGTGLWKQSFLTDELDRILEAPAALIMLKPDRFKVLVDSRGHEVGDDAMVRVAKILKLFARRLGRGWAMRFKSNETGLVINRCPRSQAEDLAAEISAAIAGMESVPPQGDFPAFSFSGTIAWALWPEDGPLWDGLFSETYALLLDRWKHGGGGTINPLRAGRPGTAGKDGGPP